jgi:hypothetical protein
MKLSHSLSSFVPSALATFGAAMLLAGSASAETRRVPAGPIWSNANAIQVCPGVCTRAGGVWDRNWRTTRRNVASECDCVFTPATPPVVTPPVATPAPAATLAPGRYNANHPHWSGFITINADRTYARDNGDPGTWTYDGTTLVLAWRNWAPETLTRQADGSFRAASNGFTIVAAQAAPPVVVVPPPPSNGELIVNGGFEQGAIGQGSFQHVAELPGWRRASGDAVEVQRGCAGAAGEGAQLVELDAAAPSAIYQDVAVTAGASYELSFLYSPRPGVAAARNNAIEVRVNGARVTTLSASGEGMADTRWLRVALPVRAATATLRVEFRDVGDADGLGGYLDGVSLTAAR